MSIILVLLVREKDIVVVVNGLLKVQRYYERMSWTTERSPWHLLT